MKKKKIICTVTNDLTYDQRMIRICTSLSKGGYDVLLVGRNKKKSIPLKKRDFQQKRLNCFFEKGKLFYLEYNIRLFFFLFFSSFDIVNAIDLDTILPAYCMSKIKRKPIVYDAHEYFTEVPEVVTRPKVQRIWKKIEQLTIPNIKYNYTVCSSLAELFEKEYETSFGVIRNVPFQTKKSEIKNKKEPKIILYQGALNEGRGLEEMIDAMQDIEGAEFWMAGEGDLSEELRERVNKRKINHKIKFLGYMQPEDLQELTPSVYVGLNLLQNKGLSYYYSLANKAFDYIQALVPAIHMDFPEYRKINQKYEIGILATNLEKETLVGIIQQLIQDEDLYQRLKENCRKARKEFIWEKEEKKLLALYKKIG